MKIFINTFYKIFFIFTAVFFICSCQKSKKGYAVSSSTPETNEIYNLTTPEPTETPEVVDISIHPNDNLNTIIDEFESSHTAAPTSEPTATPKATKDPNEELMDFIMNMETSVIPTNTPEITSKPLFASSAKAKATSKPTATPMATATPKAKSSTPKPTKTPKVTSTPKATKTPSVTEKPVETKEPTPKPTEKLNEDTAVFDVDSSGNKTSNSSVKVTGKYSYDDLYLACKVAYLEAGSTEGRKAVLNVILNRCNSSKYGGSVEDEVFRKSQFSVVNNSKFDTLEISDTLLEYANDIFNNGNTVLPSNVLYFRAKKYGTEWGSKTYYDTIGGNVFFSS